MFIYSKFSRGKLFLQLIKNVGNYLKIADIFIFIIKS